MRWSMFVCVSVCAAVVSCQRAWATAAPPKTPAQEINRVVKVSFPKDGYAFTLADVAKKIKLEYTIVVEEDLVGVIPLPFAPSYFEPPGLSGLYPREQIVGMGQSYGLLDFGLASKPKGSIIHLKKGTYAHAFEWDGRNWSGPSCTNNPKEKPFPPGNYSVTVTLHGKLVTDGVQAPYKITGETNLVLK